MRRILSISLVLASGFSAGLSAQAQQPPDSRQARKLAEQVLAGREVVVRLYHDPKNKPRAFDRLTVKLDAVYVKCDAVRLAFAASTTADDVDVSFEQLLASSQAAKTALDRLVQSAQVIQPVFEAMQRSVQVTQRSAGYKSVPASAWLYDEPRLMIDPLLWSLPVSIADSANAAGSALEQVLRSAQGDIPLDRMLRGSEPFRTTVSPIVHQTQNLRLGLNRLTNSARAIKSVLDPNASHAEQVNSAIIQILRSADEISPDLNRMLDDARTAYRAGDRIQRSVRTVERSLDKMLEQKALVVTAEDQTDEAVAAMVGEFVHGQYYRAGSLSIWPRELTPPRYPWCLFQDADKQPVAGAGVEVMIGRGYSLDDGVWLWIRNAKLDETGRLETPRLGSGPFDKFIFLVSYPDFGAVSVGPHAMELPNEPHVIYSVPVLPKDKWCVFKDALGNPMANATVEIFYQETWRRELESTLATLDDKGRLKPPRYDARLAYCCFIVSHPDYGTALVEPRWLFQADKLLQSCTVPLVHKDSEAWQRSILGVVQDEQGNPINEAVIECSGLRTAGGGHISVPGTSPWPGRFPKTITGEQGAFNFYFPIVSDDRKRLVPPNAQYSLRVIAPKELGLAEYHGYAVAGQETTITMQRQPTPEELPILIFHDESGPVTDPNRLKKVRIRIDFVTGGWRAMGYDAWLKQATFRPGTYSATADWDDERYIFEPVEIMEPGPQTVFFQIKEIEAQGTVYRGQVVHGITGQPMPGAFVMLAGFREGDFSLITAEQWQQLHQLPDEPDRSDPALEPVKAIRPFGRFVRTDSHGRFQINIKPTVSPGSLIAFEQDFLGVPYNLSRREVYNPNGQKLVTLPTIRLYPAATVLIEPQIDPEVRHISARWHVNENESQDVVWLEDLRAFYNTLTSAFISNDELLPNKPQRLQVPAGANINLTLQPIQHSRTDCAWWCPVQTETFRAAQGQIIDLGKVTIESEIPVYVKAVDSRGQALEGIVIANGRADGTSWFGQKQVTDQNGLARFYVPPYYEAAFLAGWHGRRTETPWQKLVYQTSGPQDANAVFTLQLSDEVLQQVRKQAEQGQGP